MTPEMLMDHGVRSSSSSLVWPRRLVFVKALASAVRAPVRYAETSTLVDSTLRTSGQMLVVEPSGRVERLPIDFAVGAGAECTLLWNMTSWGLNVRWMMSAP